MALSSGAAFPLISGNNLKEIIKIKTASKVLQITIDDIGLALIPALPYLIKDVPDVDINLSVIYVLYLAQTVTGYFFAYLPTK